MSSYFRKCQKYQSRTISQTSQEGLPTRHFRKRPLATPWDPALLCRIQSLLLKPYLTLPRLRLLPAIPLPSSVAVLDIERSARPKKPPEQNVEQRAEVLDGHVRRGIFDAMNMPLEGEPALERYLMPEEVATTEVSPTENTSSSALHDQPEPEHNVASPEDENDVKREEASTSAAILVGAVGAQQSFDIPPASRDHAKPEANCEPQGNEDKWAHTENSAPMAGASVPLAQYSKWLFPRLMLTRRCGEGSGLM